MTKERADTFLAVQPSSCPARTQWSGACSRQRQRKQRHSQAIWGGIVRRRLSPTRMPSTPRSQPAHAHLEAGAGCEYVCDWVGALAGCAGCCWLGSRAVSQPGRRAVRQLIHRQRPASHPPLMTSPTPRRKEKVAAPLVWSKILPLLFSLPTYRITTFFPAFASWASGRPCRQPGSTGGCSRADGGRGELQRVQAVGSARGTQGTHGEQACWCGSGRAQGIRAGGGSGVASCKY